MVGEQLLVVALGHEHRVETFLAQALADQVARADHPGPGQLAVMGAELASVLAGDVVLVGIVFEDDQVGHRTDERDLTDLLLETQEEQDTVITFHVDFALEVAAQVTLVIAGQPAQVALAVGRDAIVQAVENRPLFLLHQK
ncbi:hypothetical protein D3C79_488500 [compost metagenome]